MQTVILFLMACFQLKGMEQSIIFSNAEKISLLDAYRSNRITVFNQFLLYDSYKYNPENMRMGNKIHFKSYLRRSCDVHEYLKILFSQCSQTPNAFLLIQAKSVWQKILQLKFVSFSEQELADFSEFLIARESEKFLELKQEFLKSLSGDSKYATQRLLKNMFMARGFILSFPTELVLSQMVLHTIFELSKK